MRAVLVKNNGQSADDLYIGERPKPSPDAKEVLVKLLGSTEWISCKARYLSNGTCANMPIHIYRQRKGGYPVPPGVSDILGVEFSGTIEELGSEVSGFEVGQEVIGLAYGGAYAEYITLSAGNVMPKPKNLSWVEAALTSQTCAYAIAFQALISISELKSGEDVLIHAGASGVGVAANQLARLYGHVITTASSKDKLDFLHNMPKGSTHGVNYREQNFAEEVGVNVIIDFIGPDYWDKNIDALAKDGRMVILASMSGSWITVPKVNLVKLLYKRLRVQGSTLRSRSPEYQAALVKRFWDECGSHFQGEELKVYIHKARTLRSRSSSHSDRQTDLQMDRSGRSA
ncbi:quinone oxidoreductase [Rhizoctonia solani AG-1 IA]|uniref:Quinone oxidoreductase n=1 Tax=Thanatephorus cucumeris (strain AG1-IA) TaxID=983506 RepID=L8X528_THACA|nr:quinone oxidoreductase [Rhizoctonia solani AG-1 IA]